jgi:hypothetical protein
MGLSFEDRIQAALNEISQHSALLTPLPQLVITLYSVIQSWPFGCSHVSELRTVFKRAASICYMRRSGQLE